MIEMTVTVPRCPACGKSDQVTRERVIYERVELATGKIVRAEGAIWTDDYECDSCGDKWNELDRPA